MDIQRTGLLGILGILTYVLFLQWNIFTETQNPTTESVGAQKNKSLPSTEVPPASETFASPASDDVGGEPASSAIDDDSIVVRTPSVDITIALTGGDITQILLKDYPVSLKNPDQPIALLDDALRTYIAQSGLVGPDGPDAFQSGRPLYKASQQQYVVNEPTDISIKTETDTGLIITKTFAIAPDRYDLKVTHKIENISDVTKTLSPFVQLKRDNSEDPSSQNSMGMQAFLGYALQTADERYRKVSFSDFETTADARELNTELKNANTVGGYLALLQHYFTSAWIPSSTETHSYSFRTE